MSINIRNCIFGFKCSKHWEALSSTSNEGIKFCDDCQKPVYLINEQTELVKAIELNRCVAINSNSNEDNKTSKEIYVGMVSSVDYDQPAFKRNKSD